MNIFISTMSMTIYIINVISVFTKNKQSFLLTTYNKQQRIIQKDFIYIADDNIFGCF